MSNLKISLNALVLCAAVLSDGGAASLKAQGVNVATLAFNDAKAEKQLFNLIRNSYVRALKSARGLNVKDNVQTRLAVQTMMALRAIDSPEKVRSAGKLLSVDYFCLLGASDGRRNDDGSWSLKIEAGVIDALSGEFVAETYRSIDNNSASADIVACSQALAAEMESVIRKKRLDDKISGLKELIKR